MPSRFIAGSCLAALMLLAACAPHATTLERRTSPDNRFVASLVKENRGGAVGSQSYNIYLSTNGTNPKNERRVFGASHCETARFFWTADRKIVIQYSMDCEIYEFRNRWYEVSAYEGDPRGIASVEILLMRMAKD